MNRESRTTTLLDSILEGDEAEFHVSMSVRVACLRRATCPGCSSCNTLDMNLSRMQNARVRQDEANKYTTVYKVNISQMESDAALARQLCQDELVADMRSSVIEESDAALARQIEESDAALAHQLHHEEMQMETDAALARELRDR